VKLSLLQVSSVEKDGMELQQQRFPVQSVQLGDNKGSPYEKIS
jgi:hypothetical protein